MGLPDDANRVAMAGSSVFLVCMAWDRWIDVLRNSDDTAARHWWDYIKKKNKGGTMIDNLIQVQAHNGPLLYARPGSTDETVIREIWQENVYRMEPGDCDGVVVDIGANIGAFTTYAALHGASRVIAVEPDYDNLQVFNLNVETLSLNPRILMWPCAVWSSQGSVQFLSSAGGSRVEPTGPLLVPAHTLAGILSASSSPSIATMKMDIEGSEYPVIASTPREVLQCVCYLTMEFHATDAATFGALVAKLTETHCVQTLGSYERGGYLYCRRYQ